ncbi:MAG: EAL domain-containing protein [Gammaproteobacteria bacterium]|nr:EAL domain-containing protein [Gammaproteobacteria bacterium]
MDKIYRALIEHIPVVTYITAFDERATLHYVSPQIEDLLGYTPEEWLAEPDAMLSSVHADDRARVLAAKARSDAILEPVSLEYRLIARDGRVVWVRNEGVVVRDEDGKVQTWQGFLLDITAQRDLEAQARQAFHDALTGLPNRALFMDRLQHALARRTEENNHCAVLFLDLDRFKAVNDTFGHEAGDRLLFEVGSRLRECLRPEDTLARLGGDEFTILLGNCQDVREPVQVAERIGKALEAPTQAPDGRQIFTSASIGIVLSTPAHKTPQDLLREADIAMYRAKDRGRARFEVFDASMNANVMQSLELESQLRLALARDEFELYYMPKVEFATGNVTAIEALLRWQHPTRGVLPPAEFIAVAEETGLILPIERWVLRQACRLLRRLQIAYPRAAPLKMCVNLSVGQFRKASLVEEIAGIMRETEIDPSTLVLEFVERVIQEDAQASTNTLTALKELGVQLAVDGFGTGYSNLRDLKRYPLDILKIDKSFVAGLGHDGEGTAIVQAIIRLADALQLQTIAEGVETNEQMMQLRALGCQRGQGYYFASPSTYEDLEPLIALTS